MDDSNYLTHTISNAVDLKKRSLVSENITIIIKQQKGGNS